MLSPEEIKIKLTDMNLKAIARKTGLHYNTVYNFSRGKDCRGSVIEKLSNYFENKQNER